MSFHSCAAGIRLKYHNYMLPEPFPSDLVKSFTRELEIPPRNMISSLANTSRNLQTSVTGRTLVGVSLACIIFLRLLLASCRSRLSRSLFELCPFHERTGRFDAHAISRCVHERDSHEIIHRFRGPGSEGGRRLSFDQRYRDQTVETKIERGAITMDRCIEREGDSLHLPNL